MKRIERVKRSLVVAGLVTLLVSAGGFVAAPARAQTSIPFVQAYWAWPPEGVINPFAPNAINFTGYVNTPLAYFLVQNGTYVPELATSWSVVTRPGLAANASLTLHLRNGARWSDGTPMTAHDVLVSLELGYILGYQVNGYIASIATPDPHTVVVRQNSTPFNLFVRQILSSWVYPAEVWGRFVPGNVAQLYQTSLGSSAAAKTAAASLAALAKKIAAYHLAHYIAGGPFNYAHVTSGEVILDQNKLWWGAGNVHVAEVDVPAATGNTQMYSYALSGRADILSTYAPPTVVDPFVAQPNHSIVAPNGNYGPGLVFNTSVAPYNSLAVRRAFAYIINRREVTEIAYPIGTSSVKAATATPYPSGLPPALYSTWLTPQTLRQLNPYNPNWPKAAQLLTSAGLRKVRGAWQYAGKPLSLYIACPAGYSDWVAIAENVATQLSQFGIDAHVRTVDTTTYFSAVPTGVYPVALNFIGSSDPNPWYDYQDYVTFEGLAINAAGVVSRGKSTYNWGPMVTLPNGKTIDFVKTSHDLVATNDVQQRRTDVNELALALNSQLPAIDLLYNKFYCIFVNSTRWTGFAPASDPTWGNWPVDPLSAVALTIEKGWIKPAHS